MNAFALFVLQTIIAVGVAMRLIESRLRKHDMTQKQLLDQALQEERTQLAGIIGPAVSTIDARLSQLTSELAVKNEASQDTDLTEQISSVKGLSGVLDPLKTLAESLAAPPTPAPDEAPPLTDEVPAENGTPVTATVALSSAAAPSLTGEAVLTQPPEETAT